MDVLKLFSWDNTREAVRQLELLLQCSVCGTTSNDPQCLGRCDHFFCSECAKDLENGLCPKCKIPAPPCEMKPDRIISGLLAASRDLKDILDGGQISVGDGLEAPDCLPCTPERQIRSSVPLQDLITAKLPDKSTSEPCGQTTPPLDRTGHSKRSMQKICKKLKTTPREPYPKTKSILKKNYTPVKSSISKTISGSGKKSKLVPVTPQNKKFPSKMSQSMSPNVLSINKRNSKGETPLHVACIKGEKEKVLQLLSEGANPNTKDNAGWTPLHEACSHGFQDIAESLLRHGALVDVPGGNNENPLHDAVTQGQLDLIKLLRTWGANDTARNLYGQTPRSLAALCSGTSEIVSALDTTKNPNLVSPPVMAPQVDRMVLLGVGLLTPQAKRLDSLARMIRARLVSDFSDEVTHIVAGCLEDRVVQKSDITYKMGVASGKWILSHTWLDECVSQGTIVSVSQHEVRGADSGPAALAPANARTNAHCLRPRLFNGCHMFLWGSFNEPGLSKKVVEGLVRAGGGVVQAREPNPESISESERTVPYHADPDSPLGSCSHFIIYAGGSSQPQIKYDMAHVKSRPLSWLLACVDNWQLLPTVHSL